MTLPTTYSEALEIVRDLASINAPDPSDVAFGDAAMPQYTLRLRDAVRDLGALIADDEALDDRFQPADVLAEGASAEAGTTSEAIMVCLDAAGGVPLPEDAEKRERVEHALAMAEDFVVRHGAEIDAPGTAPGV